MKRRFFLRSVLAASLAIQCGLETSMAPALAADGPLPHVVVTADTLEVRTGYDGVVEAVRQTVIAAQVVGAIVALDAKPGDAVKAGQTIARIDARAADQSAAASEAQAQAVRAALEVATKEVERQRQLHEKRYISDAALERAEAQFKSTRAQLDAQLSQARAARTQSGLHIVRAPYAGIIAEVPVTLGDMAMPGRALATIYDTAALRVSAQIPQSALAPGLLPKDARIDIASAASALTERIEPTRVAVLPTADPSTHTVTVRLGLPPNGGYAPGTFARVWITNIRGASAQRISIPTSAVVRRAELTAVYVLDAEDRPLLRQVRLGRVSSGRVEVLAGVAPGERVVTQPQAAARLTGPRP